MVDLRKLAAIDIALLGYGLILAEYGFGVIFSLALGVFVLLRSHGGWQIPLGIYFLCLGLNYVPMLVWAISLGNRQNARAEMKDELADRQGAMRKYRRQSLLLLVPFLPLLLMATRRRQV